MFGIDDALLAGGMSLIGGMLNNNAAADRQADSQRFNAEQAQANRDFQQMMSSTAYQRGMLDMKTAGLNPILAYQKGPASSPSGATASTNPAVNQDVVTPAVNTALSARKNAAETDNMKETNNLIKLQAQQVLANTAKTMAEQNNINADTQIKNAALPKVQEEALSAKYDNSAKKADSDQRETFAGAWARRIGTTAKDALPIGDIIFGGSKR